MLFEPPKPSRFKPELVATVVALVIVALTTVFVIVRRRPVAEGGLIPTVADLQAVHAGVKVGAVATRGSRRVAVGEVVETDADGRARLRLDDGTGVVMDRSSKLVVQRDLVRFEAGRLFVVGAPDVRSTVDLGGPTLVSTGARVALERAGGSVRAFAVDAEVTVVAQGKETKVPAGNTATIAGDAVTVEPERGFDDWTHGMASPWSVRGPARGGVGELWGQTAPGEPGSPLTLRSHDVRATVVGELARTEARTTFFNAGSTAVAGDFRMALPPSAIVSGFAVQRGSSTRAAEISLADRAKVLDAAPGDDRLEWAGEGWVRGSVTAIAPGTTVTVLVTYEEWLTPEPGPDGLPRVRYRYPLATDATPPLVGELSLRVDATESRPRAVSSSHAARVSGGLVELKQSDVRPRADFVVDVTLDRFEAPARAYLVKGPADVGDTLLVRTEATLPEAAEGGAAAPEGVTLAIVMDASSSIDPAHFAAERALVEAILGGLGAKDRAVVLAADQEVQPVGPPALGPVDDARRKAVSEGLSKLTLGGATDLGRALEAAADALPANDSSALVLYVGDGRATVGDTTAPSIEARLARREGGVPRLGAVAVGPLANRLLLASLVRGTGPLFEIADSSDAARVAVDLLAEALRPTLADVSVNLGPSTERVYPRRARAVPIGETLVTVGRLRGAPPQEITVRYRSGGALREEKRRVKVLRTVSPDDVERRWAALRVEEIALRGKGREAATDVALRAKLLTPWTAWVVDGGDRYVPTRLATRVLELSSEHGGFGAALSTLDAPSGALLADVDRRLVEIEEGDAALEASIAAAARRAIDAAWVSVRACRDSRAALRPDLTGGVAVRFSLDGSGKAQNVSLTPDAAAADEPLMRCLEVVVAGLGYPASELDVTIEIVHRIELPPPKQPVRGGNKCSETSKLPMPLRRGVWLDRLQRGGPPSGIFLGAKKACELATWTDQRALLELVLSRQGDQRGTVVIARELERAGEVDAAALLRREAVRRARTTDELRGVRLALLGDERFPMGTFVKQYEKASDDAGRLAVVRKFLLLAPHDAFLQKRLLALLVSRGGKQEVLDVATAIRLDPFADATLLADAASALRTVGQEVEARRTFGELVERAPFHPYTRALLGDRLRNEGLYDEATRVYEALEELAPGEASGVLRLALAHASAGRIDLAQRLFARVSQTGGRTGDTVLGELAGRLAQVVLGQARASAGAERALVERAALELPFPRSGVVVVVRGPAGADTLQLHVLRGPKEAREERGPDAAAPGIGVYSVRLEPLDLAPAGEPVVLRLSRPRGLPPTAAVKVRVDLLVGRGEGLLPSLVTRELELPLTGRPAGFVLAGDKLEPHTFPEPKADEAATKDKVPPLLPR